MKRKPHNLVSKIMVEVIKFPGFPEILVTRHFAYHWLKTCGWDAAERGFGSLDYIVFSKPAIDTPATPDDERDHYLSQVHHDYLRGVMAK